MGEENEPYPLGASWRLLQHNDDDDNMTVINEEEVEDENGAPTEPGDLTECEESPGGVKVSSARKSDTGEVTEVEEIPTPPLEVHLLKQEPLTPTMSPSTTDLNQIEFNKKVEEMVKKTLMELQKTGALSSTSALSSTNASSKVFLGLSCFF